MRRSWAGMWCRARVLGLDRELEALESDEQFRTEPDRDRIDRWSTETHLAVWNR